MLVYGFVVLVETTVHFPARKLFVYLLTLSTNQQLAATSMQSRRLAQSVSCTIIVWLYKVENQYFLMTDTKRQGQRYCSAHPVAENHRQHVVLYRYYLPNLIYFRRRQKFHLN